MRSLDASTLRRLAVQADVDPRTLLRALRGESVRGSAGHRARRVLLEAGCLSELPAAEHPPVDKNK